MREVRQPSLNLGGLTTFNIRFPSLDSRQPLETSSGDPLPVMQSATGGVASYVYYKHVGPRDCAHGPVINFHPMRKVLSTFINPTHKYLARYGSGSAMIPPYPLCLTLDTIYPFLQPTTARSHLGRFPISQPPKRDFELSNRCCLMKALL
ncbi:hypothetical protein CPC08DRAFT_709242 [Agrocybe pediades]|nr:hypothetical protein CPC08DRAFT_709242 [Agrocybe pediades]